MLFSALLFSLAAGQSIAGEAASPSTKIILASLQKGSLSRPLHTADPLRNATTEQGQALTAYVGDYQYTSPWLNGYEVSAAGYKLYDNISNSKRYGIDRERLHYEDLSRLLRSQMSPAQAVRAHTLLSSALKLLLREVSEGRVSPESSQNQWFDSPDAPDYEQVMQTVKQDPQALDNVLAYLAYKTRNLEPLLQQIREYKEIAALGGWPQIPEGPTLEPGERSERITTLRRRLSISGDLPEVYTFAQSALPADLYTPGLQEAVEKFQSRHGLVVDGLVGKATIAALNIPVEQRIALMELNAERHRWLPYKEDSRYIVTNIPDYRLSVIDNGLETLQMPVVVGKPKHMTPVFSADMSYLVVNPTWTVPRSITNNELVPKELANPGALQQSGFKALGKDGVEIPLAEVSQESWERTPFPYTLRQGSGNNNALGKVKFMFPNPYSIYLHDTPAKSLFANHKRAYSHGCVRVGDPRELANHLLRQEGWKDKDITAVFNSQKTLSVGLKSPIRNHIVYLTSWVDSAGLLQFREDIYKQDKSLTLALQQEAADRKVLMSSYEQLQPVLAANNQE